MAMLAVQPNQAEIKNVETSYLRARYMIPIKLKPPETLGMRRYFFCNPILSLENNFSFTIASFSFTFPHRRTYS